MKSICNKAGIRQSSLNISIIKKIFPFLGIPEDFTLKSSFELIKKNIRKKTSIIKGKVRNIEDNVEKMWGAGFSIDKITEFLL